MSYVKFVKVFYSPNYVKSEVDFDTTRKAKRLSELVAANNNLLVTEPTPLTEAQLLIGHSEHYINALKTGDPLNLASSAGLSWDKHRYTLVRHVSGGVLEACKEALANKAAFTLSSGLHHCGFSKAAGFCSLNGLAIASLILLQEQKVARVVVLDLDAHGGGGTWSIAGYHPGFYQANVSVAQYDNPIHQDRSYSSMVNLSGMYLEGVRYALDWIDTIKPDLVIYNAGVDIHQDNNIGGLAGIDDQMLIAREQMVASWAQTNNYPIAGTVAGGYAGERISLDGICQLHMHAINALSELAN
jgi:acetoin utilization deacetylase AcuC-like enzyme